MLNVAAGVFAYLVYLFVLMDTLAYLATMPVVLLSLALERRTKEFPVALAIVLGYFLGGAIGWSFAPSDWPMPLWETAYASVNSAKYGHPVEHRAETLLLGFFMLPGVAGSILSGAGAHKFWLSAQPA